MLVEYLKIYKDENITLKDFMKNENIHPLVLLLKDKPDEQSSIINNKSNINDENINISYLNKDISNKTFSKSANNVVVFFPQFHLGLLSSISFSFP